MGKNDWALDAPPEVAAKIRAFAISEHQAGRGNVWAEAERRWPKLNRTQIIRAVIGQSPGTSP